MIGVNFMYLDSVHACVRVCASQHWFGSESTRPQLVQPFAAANHSARKSGVGGACMQAVVHVCCSLVGLVVILLTVCGLQ